MATVLVVDDQRTARLALVCELADAGHRVLDAQDGDEAWRIFREHQPQLVITDMVMPNSDGIELLARIRACSDIPIIMYTAYGSIETAVAAGRADVDEFISSDKIELSEFSELVQNLLGGNDKPVPESVLQLLPGTSVGIRRVRDRVVALAPLQVPVLVVGERGSGRATTARALHLLSDRSSLLTVDASSSLDDETTHDSTIYFPEVERLDAREQTHLARWLQPPAGRYGPRLVASSSVRLDQQDGFGRELARRLLRFKIEVPALRERQEDIGALAESMVNSAAVELGRVRPRITRAAVALLTDQPWIENLIDLRRVLEQAVAFSSDSSIRKDFISGILQESSESVVRIRNQHLSRERAELLAAIRSTGGNISRTAEMLGRSRSSVYRLMSKHRISVPHHS